MCVLAEPLLAAGDLVPCKIPPMFHIEPEAMVRVIGVHSKHSLTYLVQFEELFGMAIESVDKPGCLEATWFTPVGGDSIKSRVEAAKKLGFPAGLVQARI